MNIDNFNVHELNTNEMKNVNGGRNVQMGECNGGAFNDPNGGGGGKSGISWFQWYLYLT